MNSAMHFRSRRSSNRVLLVALAFVAMQTYVLYVSTFHMFHGMPPMCQLCATVKKYENGIASTIIPYQVSYQFEDIDNVLPPPLLLIHTPHYHPRAPPSIV